MNVRRVSSSRFSYTRSSGSIVDVKAEEAAEEDREVEAAAADRALLDCDALTEEEDKEAAEEADEEEPPRCSLLGYSFTMTRPSSCSHQAVFRILPSPSVWPCVRPGTSVSRLDRSVRLPAPPAS